MSLSLSPETCKSETRIIICSRRLFCETKEQKSEFVSQEVNSVLGPDIKIDKQNKGLCSVLVYVLLILPLYEFTDIPTRFVWHGCVRCVRVHTLL